MAIDTVRGNKMRSALTVLGVVIGITSIVGMTALIRGFDQSLREMIGALGPNTIFVQRFGFKSFSNPAEARNLFKRPNLTISDARAIEEGAPAVAMVDIEMGRGGPCRPAARLLPRAEDQGDGGDRHRASTSPTARACRSGPDASSTAPSCSTARTSSCSATRPTSCCSRRAASTRSARSSASAPSGSPSSACSTRRRAPAASTSAPDDFVAIPYTVYQRVFGLRAVRIARNADDHARS